MDKQTEEHVEAICRRVVKEILAEQSFAEQAAKRAIEIVTAEVGTTVLKKLAYLVGMVVLGLAGWLFSKGLWASP